MPNELKKLCDKFKNKNFGKKDFDAYFDLHKDDEQVEAEIQIEYSEEQQNCNFYGGNEEEDKMEIEGEDPIPIPNFIAPKEIEEDYNQDIKDYMDIERDQNIPDAKKIETNQGQNKTKKSRGRPKGNSKRNKKEEEIKDPKAEDIKNTIDNLMNIVEDQ